MPTQNRVSQHMSCLVWCGLVKSRIEGRRTLYRIANRRVGSLLAQARRFLETNEAQIADYDLAIDRVEAVLAERDLRLAHVFETHVHNDDVSGGPELARRAGAAYVVAAADDVAYERTGAGDGDYVVRVDGSPAAAFTGGSMLFGTVGRTDLLSAEVTEGLTRAQFHSVRHLADGLPGHVGVHPTHGFGSFCSSTATSGSDASTTDQERRSNLALTLDNEDAFVERLLSGLSAYPSYYAHMAPLIRAGPGPLDLSAPAPVDTAGHVAEAQCQMVRIGIDRSATAADGSIDTWAAGGDLRSYRTATFADLADALDDSLDDDRIVVLDIRRDDEWAEARIKRAVHRVHCASGYRAALLDRAARPLVAIDDDWATAAKLDALGVTWG